MAENFDKKPTNIGNQYIIHEQLKYDQVHSNIMANCNPSSVCTSDKWNANILLTLQEIDPESLPINHTSTFLLPLLVYLANSIR